MPTFRDFRRLFPADSSDPAGYWLYAGHLLAVWALAASNAFLGLTILWSGRQAWRGKLRWRWREHGAVLAPAGVYLALLFVSVAFSYDPAASAEELREVFSLLTLGLGAVLVRGERDVRRLFSLLIVMAAALAAAGAVQYYFTDYGTLHKRIPGPFSHYQTFAGVLLVGFFLVLGRIVSSRRASWHWLALATIVWTLFLTLTRGSWVAAAVTVTAYVLVRARRYFTAYLAAAVLATALVVVLVPATGERIRSIADVRDSSNYDRLCMLRAGLDMVAERPLFGLGPGMVEERYPIYRHPTAPRFTVPHLHNAFLQLAAERGLTSLAAYLWLMAAGGWTAWRAYRREGAARGGRVDLYAGVLLALVGFNLAGLFEDNWSDTEVRRLVLFLLAVPLCLGQSEGTRSEERA
jgi:O-antigen ligase